MEDKFYKYLNGERLEIVGEELQAFLAEREQEAIRQAEQEKALQEKLSLCSSLCEKIATQCGLSETEKEYLNKMMSK